jgi:putative ABC transport system permease protein
MIDALWHDTRYALRLVRLNSSFAAVAIVSIALAAGANTAIFQLLDAISLRALPVQSPQELVELRIDDMTHARGSWLRDNALTNPLWEQIRARQQVFQGMFAWADEPLNISTNGEFRSVAGLWVSGDFFRVLGVQPILGRAFTLADDQRGCGQIPPAVVSYGFWRRELGGDASAIGRKVAIGENRIDVVGVTPPSFFGLEVGRRFDIALPICAAPGWHRDNGVLDSGTIWWLTVMGRLKPGLSIEQAAAHFRAISAGIFQASLPADYPPVSVKPYLAMKLLAIPAGFGISRLREQYSEPLGMLMAIAGFVLLIACANLANLMLARASGRRREMAVRLAVGASQGRLIQQLLTEGLLLAAAGAVFGLLLAQVLSRFLVSFLTTSDDPVFVNLHLDWRVFIFTAGLAILTSLLFALAPALRAAGTGLGSALKSGNRSMTPGREGLSQRRVLAASQIALSLVLISAALLFVRSLRNLVTLDPGFHSPGILIADMDFRGMHLPPGRALSFRREILESLRAIPGVEAAAEATIVPVSGGNWNNRMWMDGQDSAHAQDALRSMIGDGYFRTLKTPLIAGREFDAHDLASYANVAVVNEKFARDFNGVANVVGRRFWIEATPYFPEISYEIVGVVKNAKYRDMREDFQPVIFTPLSEVALTRPSARMMIRSAARTDALVTAVRSTLARISPNIGYSFGVLNTRIQQSLLRERLMATLSGLFGILAAVLTAVGLYGVISYTVARRTSEIGIRIALGAGRRSVIGLIFRETVLFLLAGLGAGTILSLLAGRSVAKFLFAVKPNDPLTLAMAGIAIAFVAAAASYLPARGAAAVDPVTALRQE